MSDFHSLYKPVFTEAQKWNTANAIQATTLLIEFFENILSEQYIRIPHSLSAIYWKEENLIMDMERTFNEDDPYIKEEAMLAPPEHQTDRFWRRKITRLTYLICQFFLKLLTNKVPVHARILLKEDLLSPYGEQQFLLLQQFFYQGMAEDPEKRFQTLQEINDQLQYLKKELCPNLDFSCTERNLPQYQELTNKYKKMLSRAAGTLTPIPKENTHSYEIFFWIPKYENAYKIVVNIPSEVLIGRKTNKETMKQLNQLDKMCIHKTCEEKEGKYCYNILIEGDSCLSRNHAKICFPESLSEEPVCYDMGSTHGIIMFLDSRRTLTSSKTIISKSNMTFFCPKDQYLQLGNTSLRIRPVTLPNKKEETK